MNLGSTTEGSVGILPLHVPAVFQLLTGLVEVVPEIGADSVKPAQFIVSGGFVHVNPDSSVHISVMEAVPVEQLDMEVRQMDTYTSL